MDNDTATAPDGQNQNAAPAVPEEKVVYNAPQGAPPSPAPGAVNAAIPEEFLTDEDLYPTAPAGAAAGGGGGPGDMLKKKQPLLIMGIVGFVVILLLVLLIGSLLSGGKKTNEKIKLTYWGLWDQENVMNEVIKSYTQKNPNVEIEYLMMDAKDNYRERLIERSKKGTGPDIFRYHNTWVPEIGADILSAAPETVFTVDEYKKTFYPVAAKDLILNESIVGVPLGIDGLVLLYNERLLSAAGVSGPPRTWEELLDTARKVTVKDSSNSILTAGLAIGTAENVSHFSDIIGMMFLQNNVTFNKFNEDPNAITVMDTYANFALSVNNVWSEGMENSIIAFSREKVAMIFAPTWEVEVIKHLNPDITIKAVPVPQLSGGKRRNIANYWVEGVSKGSAHQEEAWRFLKFMAEKETLTKLYDLQVKSGRIFGYAYPRVDMSELLLEDPYVGAVIKDAPFYDSFPMISLTYDNGMNDDMVRYTKDAVNKMLGNGSARDALQTMWQGYEQVYKQYSFTPALIK